MAPQLRVLISSTGAYPPTALCPVNSSTPTRVKTALFDGEISVFVKGFSGDGGAGDGECYFGASGRDGMTYGIVVRGECLQAGASEVGGEEGGFMCARARGGQNPPCGSEHA
jgi:hypothetical protein